MKFQEPLYLEAVKKEYLWGTEEWLLSCHPGGMCRILNEQHGQAFLGEYFQDKEFPLLIKEIDAREALSVQVHPRDAYAWEQEGCRGKTEMWYVLDHKPGAFLYYGLKNRVTEKELRKRIRNGTLTEICRKQTVKKGDVFYIPPGMLHGIGGGIRVVEVQQNSHITYRVYDYNRVDHMQRPRTLHVEQAMDVMELMPALGGHVPLGQRTRREGYSQMLLTGCEHFSVWVYEVETEVTLRVEELCPGGDFLFLLMLEGEGMLFWDKGKGGEGHKPLKRRDSIYLPAACGPTRVQGPGKLLVSGV
ncbi:MAG: mannose-6-phosphate isomerase [Lachnospiraceae bacterium]|nr:mannose-6-phosphate isomerase [Lachnospiraceae bacterium]